MLVLHPLSVVLVALVVPLAALLVVSLLVVYLSARHKMEGLV